MKSKWIAIFALLLIATAGCSELGSFTVERTTDEVIVEGQDSPVNNVLPENVLPRMPLQFDLQTTLEEQDADGADAVYLEGLTLRITDTAIPEGDDDNFDFLRNVAFYVESADASSDLERVQIGELDPVPENQQMIDINTDNTVNLKPYAEEGLVITTTGNGDAPRDDVSMVADTVLKVDVGL